MSGVTVAIDRVVLHGLPREAEAVLRRELGRLLSGPEAARRLADRTTPPVLTARVAAEPSAHDTACAAARAIAAELLGSGRRA